jgi:RNA polymerase sigma-70 factor (ECF subfamily)
MDAEIIPGILRIIAAGWRILASTGISRAPGRCRRECVSIKGASPAISDVRAQIVALLPRLRRFCMAIAGGADAGDDLAQATIERALSRIDQWEEGTRLDSWMYRIAQNIRIDQARSAKVRGIQVDVEALVSVQGDDGRSILEARSDLAAAQSAMAALPDDQRVLMALVVLDGQSYKEAAETLSIPVGTVMSRLARARRAIDNHVHGAVA